MSKLHEFSNGDVTVVWQSELCTHSANCVKNLPAVFRPGEKPWIKITESSSVEIMNTIDKCPSGALSYRINAE